MIPLIRTKFTPRVNPTLASLWRNYRLSRFQQKVPIYIETDSLILKTAQSTFEVKRALALRHEIFFSEMQGKQLPQGLDVDGFDSVCDHLLIIDKKSGQFVGTYRLLCSHFVRKFYSQTEFDLQDIMAFEGTKLELGRACIRKEFRKGTVLNLLWRGIVEYIKRTNTKWLMGCASIQTTNPVEAAQVFEFLRQQKALRLDLDVQPLPKYRASFLHSVKENETEANIFELIPPLMLSYLKAGAQSAGLPAYDRDFSCFDFFMFLEIDKMSPLFRRRYGLEEASATPRS